VRETRRPDFGYIQIRYQIRYLPGIRNPDPKADTMPALNVTFTEDEMAQLRDATAEEETSMKTFAHDAILAALHRRKVTAAAIRAARISAGLNKRLADK
jgi:hypothetical protein